VLSAALLNGAETFAKVIWGAQCGKSVGWDLLGGDEFKKPSSLGEGTGAKVSENSEAPQRAAASRLVSTILRI